VPARKVNIEESEQDSRIATSTDLPRLVILPPPPGPGPGFCGVREVAPLATMQLRL